MEDTNLADSQSSDEQGLWLAFKQGDRQAFELIYRKHINPLISYGYKITSNRSLIQDCIQDLFVELWESRERLTDAASVKYYLLRSLRYKLIRALQPTPTEDIQEIDIEVSDDNFETKLLADEIATQQALKLSNALQLLPKRQREAIHLRYFQEMNNEEVAHIMGVGYQSACKFIYTGLKTLRDLMQLSAVISFLLKF
ncbi:MAG: RNA polymerase sigma factor [Runella zeae]